MDIKDLLLLKALAEHQHFARAAKACNISQPAFSARIQKLENDLETPIVIRGRRFAGFTEDGERVLAWARKIQADFEGLRQDLTAAHSALSGHLCIGIIPSATPAASDIIHALYHQFPLISIEIRSMSSREIQAGIDDFTLQAGLTYLANEPLHQVRTLPLFDETYRLVGTPEILSALPEQPGWKEAATLPLCLLTDDMQNRRILNAAFESAGTRPNPAIVSNSIVNLLSHVRHGGFASILPERQIDMIDRTGLQTVPLCNPEISQLVGLAIPERDPVLPIVGALWSIAERHALNR
ncbi:MAG: LysR family transcriptional regulator [Stappiaceae bacterium]